MENPETDLSIPVFLDKSETILEQMRNLSLSRLQSVWACSDEGFDEYYHQLMSMNLYDKLSPAVKCYKGVAYKEFEDILDDVGFMNYLNKHLRIISAFYGVLKAKDGIVPYRLEMASNMKIDGLNMYNFWSYHIYEECRSDVIVNLSSEEYGKCVRNCLNEDDVFIDIDFLQNGKRISSKMKKARGMMLRYMIINNIEDIEMIKEFSMGGYKFNPSLSTERKFVFECQ